MTYGTEEQKQKYLVPLAKGEKLGAFGLTEPGAGTDAQGQQTKAYLDGDEWVLNGSKIFITNGKEADVYVIFAVTSVVEDKRGRKKKMISAFIVEKGTPGFTFGTKEKKMGIRGSSTYELIFTDCRIPKDNLCLLYTSFCTIYQFLSIYLLHYSDHQHWRPPLLTFQWLRHWHCLLYTSRCV